MHSWFKSLCELDPVKLIAVSQSAAACMQKVVLIACLNMQEPSCLHFSSILHKPGYVGTTGMLSLCIGCYCPPRSNSIASCMSKHGADTVTTKQSKKLLRTYIATVAAVQEPK